VCVCVCERERERERDGVTSIKAASNTEYGSSVTVS